MVIQCHTVTGYLIEYLITYSVFNIDYCDSVACDSVTSAVDLSVDDYCRLPDEQWFKGVMVLVRIPVYPKNMLWI